MFTKWRWRILAFSRRLWVRASLFAIVGGLAALIGLVAEQYVHLDRIDIGENAVEAILNVLAASMLAVTTFSLGTLVAAYATTSSSATPRATLLMMQDSVSHNALATFLGSFLYSIVAMVALRTGLYSERGRVVVFLITIGVIVVIVVTLVRWIDYLNRLGRIGDTAARVESATRGALTERADMPTLGARPLLDRSLIPASASAVSHSSTGYVQHVDVSAIHLAMSRAGRKFYLTAVPGTFVHPARALGYVEGGLDAELIAAVREAYHIGAQRTFDQDPRFGVIVLTEIASRALSPAVNDAGTAIDIIGRLVRLLVEYSQRCHTSRTAGESGVRYGSVWAPPLSMHDLLDDAFTPIARDGASNLEVHIRLLKAYEAIYHLLGPDMKPVAARHARVSLARAEAALAIEDDKEALRRLGQRLLEKSKASES